MKQTLISGGFYMILRELRALKGWSQTDLAQKSNIKQSVISTIEAGNSEGYSVKTMKALADALEITVLDVEEFATKLREKSSPKNEPVAV
jgi:transcriptional regulator with XRE-family HTH domain